MFETEVNRAPFPEIERESTRVEHLPRRCQRHEVDQPMLQQLGRKEASSFEKQERLLPAAGTRSHQCAAMSDGEGRERLVVFWRAARTRRTWGRTLSWLRPGRAELLVIRHFNIARREHRRRLPMRLD